ncbi:hypothetical protein FRC04_007790 [Tulasnella sp. 424]|nr:hypothetical protein FRC04_007790 [Tulasnella sp. 424]
MEPDETPFALPQDVPPPLKDAEESLYRIIGDSSRVRRNMQKILHLIARCINIIEDLKPSILSLPTTFEETVKLMESVEKLDILVIKFEGAVATEALLPASLNHDMMETWESSRKEFYELLKEAPQIPGKKAWNRFQGLTTISGGAERAERTAASLLEGDQAPSNLTTDIETVMRDWKGEGTDYCMTLHSLQMQGKVYYTENAVADGPHSETWTASVFLCNCRDGPIYATYTARAATRQAAREEASRQALIPLEHVAGY